MPSPTAVALTGFIAWTLFLLVLMEGIRSKLVLTRTLPANGFTPDNANLSPFMQRLARVHANCLEGPPHLRGTDARGAGHRPGPGHRPLAFVPLGARVVQSSIHLTSLSSTAVTFRFFAFAVQMDIAVLWSARLLLS